MLAQARTSTKQQPMGPLRLFSRGFATARSVNGFVGAIGNTPLVRRLRVELEEFYFALLTMAIA